MTKLAIVFPGQGSQTVGMLAELAKEHPTIIDTFKQASEVLGYDLWQLVQDGPVEKLNMTEHTQPAMLTADIALWRLVQETVKPNYFAGHSLGEYAALVASGVISFKDAVKIVAKRGELMQNAVPERQGGIAAIIGLDHDQIVELCQQAAQGEVLDPANFNAVGQIVISGHAGAVDRAIIIAKEMGAKMAIKLPMSVPAHSSLMRVAGENLTSQLEQISFSSPTVPVVHNVDVKEHTDVSDIKNALITQVYSPVRWVETIQFFEQAGVDTVIECGPGKVLSGLIKRTTKSIRIQNLF